MAFDKDAFLTALDSMTVMELNDLVKAIEEKFGVSAAAMAAPAAWWRRWRCCCRREDRIQRDADWKPARTKCPCIKAVREITGSGPERSQRSG